MKKFILKFLIFIVGMFVFDSLFGLTMKYLQNHAKGGYIGHHNYILNKTHEDILVFGSSRAIHHYNPEIIRDSLGLSCYNCGQNGNGIVLFYGWWQLIKDHYTPHIIIYDITPDFDLLEGENNSKYLGWLRSEYENDRIKVLFYDIDPTEKVKMVSKMYRYNSKFLQNMTDFIHPLYHIQNSGYLPLTGDIDNMKINTKKSINQTIKYDFQKIHYLSEFTNDCKRNGVKLIFVASPIWYGMEERLFQPINEICNNFNIPFYNYSNNSLFLNNDNMFKDGVHLNAHGADVFTLLLVSNIKKELENVKGL